jgi:hypothetical protein
MNEYHKIQTVYLRNPETHHKTLLEGHYATPEFEFLANNQWVFTEKVDGTNIRVIWHQHRLSFSGKTDNAQIPSPLLQRLEERFLPQSERFHDTFGDADLCLYGEGYGAKIQKGGGNYRHDQDFVLFDVRIGNWWLQRHDVEKIGADFGLEVVPIIGRGTLPEMVDMARHGFASTWGDFTAEGVVARPSVELAARSGQRIITKIKWKDFAALKA